MALGIGFEEIVVNSMLALQHVSVSIGCCFKVGVMESNGMIVVAKLVEMDEVVEL